MRARELWPWALAVAGGCHLAVGLDGLDLVDGGGGGGTGGEAGSCPADACPGLDSDCRVRSCSAEGCGFADTPTGTGCDDGESALAHVCDGEGSCVDCLAAEHCPPDQPVCSNRHCIAASCTDGMLNAGETGLDDGAGNECGGMSCGPCVDGEPCLERTDCISRFCDLASGLCAPCDDDDDCATSRYCEPTSGVCEVDLANGAPCTRDAECEDACAEADGVCCNVECVGACRSCLGELTSAGVGVNGTCLPENANNDCDDGVFCNGADRCNATGVCALHQGNPCPGPDGDGNCQESCDEGAGDCGANDPDGSACVDAFYCNGDDTCSGGSCSQHAGPPCPGEDIGPSCEDSCSEMNDDCTAPDVFGTNCNEDMDAVVGNCNGTLNPGNCVGD
jgi:hypothetical protein